MITAYPKIFTLGQDYIKDIFVEAVEVTEKIDGSQFCFGKIDGVLYTRSKGAMLYRDACEKMFVEAVEYVHSIQDKLADGKTYYAEYLKTPKHNTLKYARIPKNHLILFGVIGKSGFMGYDLEEQAENLGIEAVPILKVDRINSITDLMDLLDLQSVLGGAKIEGVVVKNYQRPFLLGGQPLPLMAGKLVSERFKEVHKERWGKEEAGKSKLETFFESFRSEARWEKAIQHLRDAGQLTSSPQDIGKLIKEIQNDIEGEETEAIKTFLFNQFKGEIKRKSTAGFPEWYKMKLAGNAFQGGCDEANS